MMIKKYIHNLINYFLLKIRFKIYDIIKKTEQDIIAAETVKLKESISIIGEEVHFNGSIYISDPKMLIIGTNVHIGNNAFFNTAGGLIIEDNVHLSRNVTIYTSSHNYEGGLPYDQQLITKRVIIKKNAWVGMNVSITPGVTIGEGAIIGLGAVVSKDIPDYAIIGNQEYRILKYRDVENYNKSKELNRIGGINGELINIEVTSLISGKEIEEKLFFIVSTGRSGTTSFAHILNQHPQIICKHELTDILIDLSTQYEHGEISREEAKKVLKCIYCDTRVFPKNKWFGESNHKLSSLIPILHELLPKARFIWLIRDGKKVVSSTFARGWYSKENEYKEILRDPKIMKWDNYRILGYKTGDFSIEEWNSMTPFAKNCWYWSKWNSIIETGLGKVPANQQIIIRLEDLIKMFPKLSSFLGLPEKFVFREEKKNIANYQKKDFDDWNHNENLDFNNFCGNYYKKYYSSK